MPFARRIGTLYAKVLRTLLGICAHVDFAWYFNTKEEAMGTPPGR